VACETIYSPLADEGWWESAAPEQREFTPCSVCGKPVEEDARDPDGWAIRCDVSIEYDDMIRWTAHTACIQQAFPHAASSASSAVPQLAAG
jgi:hypothetical protein